MLSHNNTMPGPRLNNDITQALSESVNDPSDPPKAGTPTTSAAVPTNIALLHRRPPHTIATDDNITPIHPPSIDVCDSATALAPTNEPNEPISSTSENLRLTMLPVEVRHAATPRATDNTYNAMLIAVSDASSNATARIRTTPTAMINDARYETSSLIENDHTGAVSMASA